MPGAGLSLDAGLPAKGLEGLLREPNGCFEQTSTSNYPNVLILDYLKESDQAQPEVEARARDLLDRGYQKLTSFECPKTAANSEARLRVVRRPGPRPRGADRLRPAAIPRHGPGVQGGSTPMLERTRQYLLASRDGKGGFKRNPRALDTFGRAPDNITNAYIVWALTESGKDDDVTKELDALAEQAKTSKDPYFLALVANSLINRDQAGRGGRPAEDRRRPAEGRRPSRRREDEHHRLGRPRSADRDDGPGGPGLAEGQPPRRVHRGRSKRRSSGSASSAAVTAASARRNRPSWRSRR